MSKITVKSAKQKGRNLQQAVRDKLIGLLEQYGAEPDDVKSVTMGVGGEDIQLSPFARSLLPVSIECKSHKAFAVYSHYEQAVKAAGCNEPILVIKGDYKKPLVLLDLDYYLSLEGHRIAVTKG